MNLITSIIIDDEEHNRNVLKTLLCKYCPLIDIVSFSSSADDAFIKINKYKPKLIFLDIKMPTKSGFDLLKMFSYIDFEVIFVSAFNQYAITAFEFNALGYILKPIDFSKLITVVDKAIIKINSNKHNNDLLYFIKTLEDKTDLINKISIHHQNNVMLINVMDIISIEAINGICILRTINNLDYSSSKGLKLFERMFMEFDCFVSINRSTVINLAHLSSYKKGDICTLEMCNNSLFEVSRRKKKLILNKINSI